MFDAPVASATALTTAVAQRVKALRTAARLSGADLAERMAQHGVAWNRTTVAKLETGRRTSLTVDEFLALALALDVPPPVLLADPRVPGRVPITSEIELDSWAALMWACGIRWNADGVPATSGLDSTTRETFVTEAAADLSNALQQLRQYERRGRDEEAETRRRARDEERHRAALTDIQVALDLMRALGATRPELPETEAVWIRQRAEELGVPVLALDADGWPQDGD